MPQNTDFQKRIADTGNTSVSIPAGKTESGIFNCGGMQIIAIETSDNFTSSTLTFKKVGIGDGTAEAKKDVFDADQNPYTITVNANGYYPIDPSVFVGVGQFKVICSDTQVSETSIAFVQIPLLYS